VTHPPRLLTIYDLEIEAKWKGTSAAGDEVTGRLSIPEFSHEAADGLEATQFNWSADGSGKAVDEVYAVVRRSFPAVLEGVLSGFRAELLAAHGVFLEGGASTPASGTATPADRATQSYSPAPPGEVRAKASPAPKAAEKKVTKTTTVELTATMQASADDLWSILTDQARVPMWSRSAAKITPVPGTEYELFSGNVSGKIVSVDKPNKLVQTWNTKSPGWPAGESRGAWWWGWVGHVFVSVFAVCHGLRYRREASSLPLGDNFPGSQQRRHTPKPPLSQSATCGLANPTQQVDEWETQDTPEGALGPVRTAMGFSGCGFSNSTLQSLPLNHSNTQTTTAP
jgi:hypothetical protein